MQDSLVAHVKKLAPQFSGAFEIRRKPIEFGVFAGAVALRFDTIMRAFANQMKHCGHEILVSSETPNACRSCGATGHDFLTCTAHIDKSLGEEEFASRTEVEEDMRTS